MKSFHVQSVQMHCSIQNDMQSFSCSYCKCSPSMKMNRALIMAARFSPLCVLLASLLNAVALRSQSEGCSDRAAWVFLSRAGRAQGPLASSAELPSCPLAPENLHLIPFPTSSPFSCFLRCECTWGPHFLSNCTFRITFT